MTDTPSALSPVLEQADRTLDAAVDRLFAFLRIPSISTQPEHAADCARAAKWLHDELDSLGFDARICETAGHPILIAHDRTPPEGPHVLFYGHYDVQPVDPLELWNSGPFEPVMDTAEDGTQRIVARGASDDKGQVMTFIEAIRAIRATQGTMPVRISLLIEGEEECGGPNLVPFMEAHREELRADVGLICDTAMLPGVPAITTALRGMVGEEVHLRCARRDLHSGVYGNAARNPAELLCQILSSIRDPETGRVTLPGFYAGVQAPPQALRDRWREIAPDDATFLGEVGLSVPAGEKGYTAIEQTWCRPSFEINGISSGYTGEGFKTVLPGEAVAKVSFRLVAGQDPVRIRQAFCSHVRSMLPEDCTVTFAQAGGSPACTVPEQAFGLQPALAALGDEWGTPAVTIGCGGSIPVAGDMQRILGMSALLVGFALDDDRAHSPNEKYELTSFHKGIRSWVRILHAMATPMHEGELPLALTMGDPAGIGPEITAGAWRAMRHGAGHFAVIGDAQAIGQYDVPVREIDTIAQAAGVFADAVPVLPVSLPVPPTPGQPDSRNAGAITASIARAVELARTGQAAAVVTCPISKIVLKNAGFPYPGHTEYLAALCDVSGAEVMMLACPELRVVPVTIHVSLRRALDELDTAGIIAATRTTHAALRRDFGIASPRIAIAGLNPHAGESGSMGTEEQTVIAPALEALRADGMDISGPWPPDTMFTPAARARYDVAMCMYHDQALIPLKTIDMTQGVNITLGLPIIRTSPDHGTAFDIAGRGVADPSSLVAALRMAMQMAEHRNRS